MSLQPEGFFVTGGTMGSDALSYVEREADSELRTALLGGRYCYVLTARQMGKSSLMVRTAAALRAAGVRTVLLDLTAIGRNLSPEQWYYGLLSHLAQQLGIESEVRRHWQEHPEFGPVQRWIGALREVALPALDTSLVVFLDEIDAVRGLPFSTAEFFASIRECFNRRTHDPTLRRLTFCLLGVATPSDLIEDTRTTPFNIGERIELSDFGVSEASPLTLGLQFAGPYARGRTAREAEALLRRVLHWTGGHPYLTQKLCRAVALDTEISRPRHVDRMCQELFLTPAAQQRDDNLLFARDRLLRWQDASLSSSESLIRILDLYLRIWRFGVRQTSDADAVVDALRLSGLVAARGGKLRVRNRIYARVFDRSWVEQHLPGAELQRQGAAYRRGLIRSGMAFSLVATLMAALSFAAFSKAQLAERRLERERLNAYAATMNLVQSALTSGDYANAKVLLGRVSPYPESPDLRDIEWRLAHDLCRASELNWSAAANLQATALRFTGEDRLFGILGDHSRVDWRVSTRESSSPVPFGERNVAMYADNALSPDGKHLLLANWVDRGDHSRVMRSRIEVCDLSSNSTIFRRELVGSPVQKVAFSPQQGWIAVGTGKQDRAYHGNELLLLNMHTKQIQVLSSSTARLNSLSAPPNANILVAGFEDGVVEFWRFGTKPQVMRRQVLNGPVDVVTLSPDGEWLAAAGRYTSPVLLRWRGTPQESRLPGPEGQRALAWSEDGKWLAGGGPAGRIIVWDLRSPEQWSIIGGLSGGVSRLAFGHGGTPLAAVGAGSAATWNLESEAPQVARKVLEHPIHLAAINERGHLVAVSENGECAEFDRKLRTVERSRRLYSGKPLAISADGMQIVVSNASGVSINHTNSNEHWKPNLPGWKGISAAFSETGNLLAVGGSQGRLAIIDTTSRQIIGLQQLTVPVSHLAFSPNGKLLACVSEAENRLRVFETRPFRKRHEQELFAPGAVCFSPDSREVAVSSNRGLRFIPLGSGPEMKTPRHEFRIECVVYAPGGRTVITGCGGGLRLWNRETGLSVLSLPIDFTSARVVLPSKSGETIWAATDSGAIYRWTSRARRPSG